MMPGHRARLYATSEAVAHHHFIPLTPGGDEARNFAEVIAVVSIPHYDKTPSGCEDAGPQGMTVSPSWHVDNASAQCQSDLLRSVGRTVVTHDNFPIQSGCLKRSHRL